MIRTNRFLRDPMVAGLIALAAAPGAMIALSGTAAHAEGKGDRADKAIAEAQGKVDIAAKLPTAGAIPQMQADASAALREARQLRSSGKKDEAITLAMKASEISDRAVAEAKMAQAETNATASNDVAIAQANAADANARADAAEQAARAAAADAAAARAAPPVMIAQAPATTEVTTTTTKAAPTTTAARKRVVRKTTVARPAARATETTTTKVTTTQN